MSAQANAHEDILQFGTFTLGSQVFGVNILRMREIIRPVEITRVPRAEKFVEGVINLRGSVIPIISLRSRFGMPLKPFDKETRIINIELADIVVGFIVDSIGHVHRLPAGSIEPPPVVTTSVATRYIAGISNVGEQLLVILNVDELVSAETLKDFA